MPITDVGQDTNFEERELGRLLEQRKAEISMFKDLETQRGTPTPALFSIFYKFIQNPSSVSVDTFKRMIDTDETCGSGTDFLTTCLSARLGKYQHKSSEITEWINARLSDIQGGFFNFIKEMYSAAWSGYYVGEKVWHNTENGFVVDRIIPMPPVSVLFEVNREGQIEPDGILQYQRNISPLGISQGFNFFGGVINAGFSLDAGGAGGFKPDPFAKFGDLPYPLRTANSFAYLSIRIPRDKCIHYAFDAQGKLGNPYGRSLLRRCFNAYVAKMQVQKMMLQALDRKGTPLMVVYSAPNATVKDPDKVRGLVNAKGQNVGMDAAKSVSQAFRNIHNDTVVTLPGKKGQLYDVDVIPMDANADQFITVLQHYDRAIMRGLLIPSLIFNTGDGSGSFALGEAHFKTFDKICDGINQGVEDVLKRQLIYEMLAYNFPKSAWERDGFGGFTKREMSQDEKLKEKDILEFAINHGVVDTNDLADFNAIREKIGFEAKDEIPASVQEAQNAQENGNDEFDENDAGSGDNSGEPEQPKPKSKAGKGTNGAKKENS